MSSLGMTLSTHLTRNRVGETTIFISRLSKYETLALVTGDKSEKTLREGREEDNMWGYLD